jgi:predicted GNAT family acetyltransferase
MKVVVHTDAQSLWNSVEALLCRDPANNTHQLGALMRLIDRGAHHGQQYFAIQATDAASDIVGSAVIVDTRTVFLSVMPGAAAQSFGQYCNEHGVMPGGVMGRVEVVDAFEAAYGRPSTVLVQLMLYKLMGTPQFGRATGRARVATHADATQLVEWHHAFEAETNSISPPTPMSERIRQRIDAAQLVLWVDDDEVVAFAGANPLPAGSARIGPVYTLPAKRSRGYAQAVTAAAGEHIQRIASDSAARTLFLFTDAALPASNKAYQRIGYVHIADHIHRVY